MTTPAPVSPGAAPMTRREILAVVAGLMVGMFLAALDQTIVSTALPTIVGELGGLEQLSWTVTAYLLTSTATTPLWGKVGDLYGRKRVFQAAIVVFVVGSLVCGSAGSMLMLIVGRGVQGIGAGGLIALTLAIIGDIVSPRERGRYQGLFGAVWGTSSIAGPLLGGFFTESLTWRWVFWINVPLGLLALVVIQRTLHLPPRRVEHAVDYVGAALVVAAVTSLLLVTVWGGERYPWGSPVILGMITFGLLTLGAFVWWERRVPEPLLPLRLFGSSVVTVTSIVSFLFGFAFFGAIVFLPLYLQIVKGYTPTTSGLLLLPLVLGLFLTSTTSGLLIARTGRYTIYPTVGLAMAAFGLWWLSRLTVDTPVWDLGVRLFVLGIGLGLVIQTLLVAVQNAVPFRDLGVATSSNTFFRSMGGAFGTAVLGALLTAVLGRELANGGPGLADVDPEQLSGTPEAIRALPDAVREPVLQAFTVAIDQVFLVSAAVCAVAFVVVLFLDELPLRDTSGLQEAANDAAQPTGL